MRNTSNCTLRITKSTPKKPCCSSEKTDKEAALQTLRQRFPCVRPMPRRGGINARLAYDFFRFLKRPHLARIIKVDLKTELFSYAIDEAAQAQAELMDGKLLLVTNVPDQTPVEVVKRYKSLADIERGFRVLKSEIEIAPVHHRLPQRIRAHAFVCFIALIVYRVMRQRLKLAKSDLSPEKALAQLRRIQRHSVSINASPPIAGISTVNDLQSKVFAALKTKKPTQDTQMSLL
jgi:hypothetical protein